MNLSTHQEMVLEAFKLHKILRVSQLKSIYTTSEHLKLCLQKLEALGKIKLVDYGKFEYIGDEQ